MDQTTDSSSSDDDENRLREALDNSMFSCDSPKKLSDSSKIKRNVDTSFKNNILNVTPEFQSFVAKRLSELLDRTILEKCIKETHYEADDPGGVKLFNDSKRVLSDKKFYDPFYSNCQPNESVHQKKKSKKKRTLDDVSESDSDLMEKVRSAAVSPEWVLQKRGTNGYSKPKGEEMRFIVNKKGDLVPFVPIYHGIPR